MRTYEPHRVPRLTRRVAVLLAAAWVAGCDGATDPDISAPEPAPPEFDPPAELTGRLAFASDREGDPEIYAIDVDGSDLQRLTTSPGSDDTPAWSPDGTRIAFVSDRDGGSNIRTMASDGSGVVARTAGLGVTNTCGGAYDPAWSSDGSAIAFSTACGGSAALATVDEADGTIGFLINHPSWGDLGQPSWSPDGRRLAFVSSRGADYVGTNIYTINADGTGARRLDRGLPLSSPHPTQSLHPAWSPDGSMIAFVYGRSLNGSYDLRFTVAIMSAEGEFIEDLAWAGDIPWEDLLDPGSLTWSPDGGGVAYTFVDCDLLLRTGCSNVRSVKYASLDGGRQGTIVANARNPSWRP